MKLERVLEIKASLEESLRCKETHINYEWTRLMLKRRQSFTNKYWGKGRVVHAKINDAPETMILFTAPVEGGYCVGLFRGGMGGYRIFKVEAVISNIPVLSLYENKEVTNE